jgi:23S rRNA (cytidine1920-2'-O)/16S rRNA (cytidine1409-2'-O)-methyltransferase
VVRRPHARFVALTTLLANHREVTDPVTSITSGHVRVDGRIITNARAQVRADAAIRIAEPPPLRGEHKLGRALDAMAVIPAGRVAVDVGAAAGGFTRALLHRGARRVYAVDVGHGQLLGSLRQDERVVDLERVNIADLSTDLVPDVVDLLTLDLSYLPVAVAVGQLEGLEVARDAELVALVKPTFELRTGRLDLDPAVVRAALARAGEAIESSAWSVAGITVPSVTGAGGAVEAFIHARRR